LHGIIGEGFDAGAAGKAGAGFVEGDVAVWSYAREEEFDAAGASYLLFVGEAFGLEVWSHAV
jgi:hypothetical protein